MGIVAGWEGLRDRRRMGGVGESPQDGRGCWMGIVPSTCIGLDGPGSWLAPRPGHHVFAGVGQTAPASRLRRDGPDGPGSWLAPRPGHHVFAEVWQTAPASRLHRDGLDAPGSWLAPRPGHHVFAEVGQTAPASRLRRVGLDAPGSWLAPRPGHHVFAEVCQTAPASRLRRDGLDGPGSWLAPRPGHHVSAGNGWTACRARNKAGPPCLAGWVLESEVFLMCRCGKIGRPPPRGSFRATPKRSWVAKSLP